MGIGAGAGSQSRSHRIEKTLSLSRMPVFGGPIFVTTGSHPVAFVSELLPERLKPSWLVRGLDQGLRDDMNLT